MFLCLYLWYSLPITTTFDASVVAVTVSSSMPSSRCVKSKSRRRLTLAKLDEGVDEVDDRDRLVRDLLLRDGEGLMRDRNSMPAPCEHPLPRSSRHCDLKRNVDDVLAWSSSSLRSSILGLCTLIAPSSYAGPYDKVAKEALTLVCHQHKQARNLASSFPPPLPSFCRRPNLSYTTWASAATLVHGVADVASAKLRRGRVNRHMEAAIDP